MIDYDKIALEYARHRQVHPEVLRNLVSFGRVEAGRNVLEVGCGTGNYVAALESIIGCAGWGIDPSERMLAAARKRSAKVNFQPGSAEKIPFSDVAFDLVFSADVIHHVADREGYFREAYRVLKGNRKVCTVTDSEWIIRHRQPLSVFFPETVEADLGRYSRIADLRKIMIEVDFRDIAENLVEFSYDLTDIDPYRAKAFSCLRLISDEAFQEGIRRMEQDLRSGPIQGVSRYLLLWGTKGPSRGKGH